MKAMESLQDLIDEAKLRTVWWALCIFAFSYFLTHTSKSMWMNIPISILLVAGLRILLNEVEFRWKCLNVRPQTYLSHLEKKQLSVNDFHLSTSPPPPKWNRKIDSPTVEAAMEDFVKKLLQNFVVDLWYSDITPDKEAPQLIHAVVMDALAEISVRVKDINLVDLLTRDIVDLVGDHLDLFRRNQSAIGVDVMGTLSSDERDERLKHHLMASKELHPALISPECEYKVLQRLTGGLLATVLRPREAQCPLVRCIARELLTCLVMQPIMNFASPGYINELIEYILLAVSDKEVGDDHSLNLMGRNPDQSAAGDSVQNVDRDSTKGGSSNDQKSDMPLSRLDNQRETPQNASGNNLPSPIQDEPLNPRPADWARILEAASQRRTEVLMPENLENMWTKGRNYKKKAQKNATAGHSSSLANSSEISSGMNSSSVGKELLTQKSETATSIEGKTSVQIAPKPHQDARQRNQIFGDRQLIEQKKEQTSAKDCNAYELTDEPLLFRTGSKSRLKKSNSTSDVSIQPNMDTVFSSKGSGPIVSEFYSPDKDMQNEVYKYKSPSEIVLRIEGQNCPKLRCRVIGAYFEKLASKSFAVYSIAVTDADKKTWFVKRRYRNFERLHRYLKDIPNYTLHLPPKRIFSSSTEDAFVHQRCIQLDKYLQDLLSIANVAEQHEVWDFLSISSKNYSFGKSSSVMKTLAVNVDDAVDDIVRQFKGVSDGLMRKVVGPSPSSYQSTSLPSRNLSWKADEINNMILRQSTSESANSFFDNEEGGRDGNHGHEEIGSTEQSNGWHSDNELHTKGFPPRVVKSDEQLGSLDFNKKSSSGVRSDLLNLAANFPATSDKLEDPLGVPPEWTPPNLSVPVLNLVDNIFQLKRRGWLSVLHWVYYQTNSGVSYERLRVHADFVLNNNVPVINILVTQGKSTANINDLKFRRQVFWISKQILQLMMEDAIDDWLLRQIHWLRREDIIAQGIRWIQDVLWPGGTFFIKLNARPVKDDSQHNQGSSQTGLLGCSKVSTAGSFEQQLEAARRASDVKKMLFNGAPTTLVSLIGHKQYKRRAKDIYYFTQSTICLKQLGYGILELLLVTIFPELRDVVVDVHEKMCVQPG